MTVNVNKPSIDLRNTLTKVDQSTGVAGEAMLRAKTPQEQFNLISAGRKNIIQNGDMRVAQRGTSSTFGQSDKGYKTVDRFLVWEQGTPTAAFNLTQETDAPNEFINSTKIQCTTANSSGIPSAVHMYLENRIETQDLTQLAWGTSDAKYSTLSFWVKSNTPGTYVVSFIAYNGTDYDYYTAPYEVDDFNEKWQYISIVIPPNTISDLTSVGATNAALQIKWVIQSGSTYSGGTPLDRWTDAPSTNQFEAGQTADVGATVGNYWQITGIQLEAGNIATPFEHRSYAEELALCQRYYYRTSTSASDGTFGSGFAVTTTSARIYIPFPVPMRADVTGIEQSGSAANYKVSHEATADTCNSVPTFQNATNVGCAINASVASGLTAGNACMMERNSGTAYIGFTGAEL